MPQEPERESHEILAEIYQELGSDICLYPFFGAFYQTNNVIPVEEAGMPNSVRPCSIVMAEDRHKWNINNSSVRDARNSEVWRQMRRDFVEGRFHDIHDCRSCSYNERSGTTSPRQQNNRFFVDNLGIDIVREVKDIIARDYEVNDVLALDYYPSNYCNFSCVMCAGGASSKRQTFEVKVLNKQEKIVLNSPDPDFYSVLDRVKIINFTGGETVLQRQVHDIIDYLIESGRSHEILITLLTNGSSYPDNLIDKFQRFRGVIYNVSIDGVGAVIEYQRRGCVWSEVEANSLRLIQNRDFFTVVNYVLTAINVLSAMDFVDWAYGNGIGPQDDNDMEVNFINISPVFRVDHLGQSALPPELRSMALGRLHQGLRRYLDIPGALAEYHRRIIQKIISIINNTPWDPDHTLKFWDHIRQEDTASKRKFLEVVPEWGPYMVSQTSPVLNVHYDRIWAGGAAGKENAIDQYLRSTYPDYCVRLVDSILLEELEELNQWSGIISDTYVFDNPHPDYHCLAPELWHIFLCEAIDDVQQPDRMYSCSINRISGERLMVLYKLFQRGWLDQGHVNFNCSMANSARDLDIEQRRHNFDLAHQQLDRPEFDPIYEALRPQMPMLLPDDHHLRGGPDLSALRSRISIVMETYHNRHSVVFSEKIFRALQTPRPWVMYSSHGAVELLRKTGFDVLDDLVDHEYDQEQDPELRMDLMLDAVPGSRLDIDRCQQAVLHNQEILRRLTADWSVRLEKLAQSIGSRHHSRVN
jgi:MoaA/NifB/PqqE/SkfB family radical SAM enzyme